MRAFILAVLIAVTACCVAQATDKSPGMVWKLPRDTLLILDYLGCGEDSFDGACADLAFDCDPYIDDQKGRVMMSAPLSHDPKSRPVRIKLKVGGARGKTFKYNGSLDPFAENYVIMAEMNVGDPLFEALAREETLTMTLGRERREVPLTGIAEHLPYFLAACSGLSS